MDEEYSGTSMLWSKDDVVVAEEESDRGWQKSKEPGEDPQASGVQFGDRGKA